MALFFDGRGFGFGLDVLGWGILDGFALWERRWAGRGGFVLDWIGLDWVASGWHGMGLR